MSIQTELSKPEYQTGTYAERLALLLSKAESVVGKIAYGNTLHLVSMLARGLRRRIEDCQIQALKNAWSEALQPAYLASPSYSINVSLPEIRAMLDAGLSAGVCTQDEYDFVVQLATFQRQLFPSATMIDVISHFEPSLLDGQWHEMPETNARKLRLMLNAESPESTVVVVQMCEDGANWFHATAIHGIQSVRPYYADLPHNGTARKLRWRCEYLLDCTVTVV